MDFVNSYSVLFSQSALEYLTRFTHLSQNSEARYAVYLEDFLKYLRYDFDLSTKRRPIFYLKGTQMS